MAKVYLDWIKGGENLGDKPFLDQGAVELDETVQLPKTRKQIRDIVSKTPGPSPRSIYYVMGDNGRWKVLDGFEEITHGPIRVRAMGPPAGEEMYSEVAEIWGGCMSWAKQTLMDPVINALHADDILGVFLDMWWPGAKTVRFSAANVAPHGPTQVTVMKDNDDTRRAYSLSNAFKRKP